MERILLSTLWGTTSKRKEEGLQKQSPQQQNLGKEICMGPRSKHIEGTQYRLCLLSSKAGTKEEAVLELLPSNCSVRKSRKSVAIKFPISSAPTLFTNQFIQDPENWNKRNKLTLTQTHECKHIQARAVGHEFGKVVWVLVERKPRNKAKYKRGCPLRCLIHTLRALDSDSHAQKT